MGWVFCAGQVRQGSWAVGTMSGMGRDCGFAASLGCHHSGTDRLAAGPEVAVVAGEERTDCMRHSTGALTDCTVAKTHCTSLLVVAVAGSRTRWAADAGRGLVLEQAPPVAGIERRKTVAQDLRALPASRTTGAAVTAHHTTLAVGSHTTGDAAAPGNHTTGDGQQRYMSSGVMAAGDNCRV